MQVVFVETHNDSSHWILPVNCVETGPWDKFGAGGCLWFKLLVMDAANQHRSHDNAFSTSQQKAFQNLIQPIGVSKAKKT